MSTYSPAVATRSRATSGWRHAAEPWPRRACALRMPNRRPEKTFITSCRPQDPLSCTKLCAMRKIWRIQMRNRPRVEPHSISPKPSPPIHLRRQVGNMVPSSLRVFRDLIIFRENRRKCASIRSARAVPSPVLHFSVINFFVPIPPLRFLSPVPCPRSLSLRLSPPTFFAPARQRSPSANNSTTPSRARKMQPHVKQRLPPFNRGRGRPTFCTFTPRQEPFDLKPSPT